MKNAAYTLIIAALVMGVIFVSACEPESTPYYVSARDKGMPFDMTVSETRRTPTKTFLKAPGFSDRSALQARWLMCVFTDVARTRGFKYWTVVYPPEAPGQDQLVLAFSNSDDASPAELLGADFVSDRTLGEDMTEVSIFMQFCKQAGLL